MAGVDKMSMTALQCETVRQLIEVMNYFDYGFINYAFGETAQNFQPLLLIVRIFRQSLQFCVGFQQRCPFYGYLMMIDYTCMTNGKSREWQYAEA